MIVLLCALLATASASADERTLRVWAFGEEGNRLKPFAEEFERENPGLDVVVQAIPWSAAHDKLITSAVGGVPPDVCQMGTTWMAEFQSMDALLPLDDLIASTSGLGEENYYPGSWKTVRFDGRTYGLPWYVDARVLYYRKDLLARAGLDGPPETIEEWKEAARRLREIGVRYPVALAPSDGGTLGIAIWLHGGEPLTPDFSAPAVREGGFRAGLDWYVSWFEEGLSPVADIGMSDFIAMREGYTAIFVSGPWMMGLIKDEAPQIADLYDVATIPRGVDGVSRSFVGGCNLVVFREARAPEAAKRFVAFMSRPDVQVRFYLSTKGLPAVRSAWDDPALADPKVQVFRRQLETATPPPPIPKWEEIQWILGQRLEGVVRGRLTRDEAIGIMDAEIRRILAPRPAGQSTPRRLGLLGGALLAVLLGLWAAVRVSAGARAATTSLDAGRHEAPARVPVLFMLPAVSLLAVFLLLPILAAFLLSLTDWDITAVRDVSTVQVTGIENYRRILADEKFWIALRNTALFAFVGVPTTMALGLLAAVVLDQAVVRGRVLFRTGFFLPVVTTMVAVAVVWKWVYNPEFGLLNQVLGLFGAAGRSWLSDPALALPCMIVMAVWKNFGYSMVIFLAGLQGIPKEYYEAARIDGAGAWDRFVHITLPLLAPTTFFIGIMTTIGYLQFFAEPYIMSPGGTGGPDNATLSIVLYMYQQGFKFYNLGYASSIAYVLFAIIVFFSALQILVSRRLEAVK